MMQATPETTEVNKSAQIPTDVVAEESVDVLLVSVVSKMLSLLRCCKLHLDRRRCGLWRDFPSLDVLGDGIPKCKQSIYK